MPDITYAINVLSQFQNNLDIKHFEILLKLFGYVIHTENWKLNISISEQVSILGFSDVDYAANKLDRTSFSGCIILLGGSPISWSTRKQKSVALLTMESEYIALTEAAKE